MDKVYWVTHELAGRCGPAVCPWDAKKLYKAGFRAIISLDDAVNTEEIVKTFDHFPLYLPDVPLSTLELREQFLKAAEQFIHIVYSYKEPILVHCHAGNDRTGAMLACFLILNGKTADEAIAEVRKHNKYAMTTPGYEEVVHLFEDAHFACTKP
ncbi:MAG: dual specificity protein phosphatase family protein [Theionarchaea archaeon]|nr:MAG: hypothetical protein AYK18_01225 [Theionarchaea archaeon DG-70]MBU7011015.1 dual specificity protein phosphatase family protein [Theionarchaea archaeon]